MVIDSADKKEKENSLLVLWKEGLMEEGTKLGTLTTTSEDEFLSIGRELTGFHSRAGQITAEASSLLGLMSGNDINESVTKIEDILEGVGRSISTSETIFTDDLKTLKQTLADLDGIVRPLNNFKKLTKILKILSISTKIESAQLKREQAGFITLADEVEKLSIAIEEETKTVERKASTLGNIVRESISLILSLEKNQYSEIHRVVRDIGLILKDFRENDETSRKGADLISEKSARVSRNISEVVASMQFHDITRQAIEHVKEVLEGLTATDRGKEYSVDEFVDVCELQQAQLSSAKQQISRAIGNIIDNLLQIKDAVLDVAEEARKLAGITDKSSTLFISKAEANILNVINSLDRFSGAGKELSGAIGVFLSTSSDISESVNGIEDICTEVELIALNARVKTAHTGEEGAPLGVIAEAIQKLSLDSNNQKSIVAAALIDITQSAHRIKSYMSGRDEVSEKSDAALEFSRIADLLRQEKEQVIRSLTIVSQSSVKFAEDINSLVSAIKVQERFERILGNSILVLGNVIREGRNMSGHDRLNGDKSEYLKNLERSYTMQSERKIHDRFAGPDKGGDENYSDQIIFPANNGSSQQEFGDNVELF